ncbi:MAG: DUF1343 domain-containing protein [Gemmatimonadetes bacterium]|nr:DUF1343 domain-containing protein [Gemmatimonadota bacterium]
MAAVVAVLGCGGAMPPVAAQVAVRPGVDVLLSDSLHLVRGKRVGLVTNLAAVDARGISAVERFRGAPLTLAALFGPEHGLSALAAPGEKVASSVDSASRIPIYSLYGATRRPTPEMLAGLDVLVIDLPDVGARYYTYPATAVEVLQAAQAAGLPVIIADRPNPITGTAMQGNILDMAHASMVGLLAIPMRHGLTLGEETRLAAADLGISTPLIVVPSAGWRRGMDLDATGLPFRAPSPNLIDLDGLYHYPGTCLFEGTALSVGRGTDHPFHQVGAPWLDTTAVLARMRAAALPGVRFEGVRFTPTNPGDGKFAGVAVSGVRLVITDRRAYDPTAAAVHLLAAIRAVHPAEIRIGGSFDRLAGGPTLREALLRGEPPATIIAGWEAGLARYRDRVKPFLLY